MYMYKRLLDIYFLGQDVMSSKLLKVQFFIQKNLKRWMVSHGVSHTTLIH